MNINKTDIIKAAERISPFIHNTPLLSSKQINNICESNIIFKCENFQKAGAFKSRGANNAILSLSPTESANGVITHSSGNHAGALALAAKNQGIKAYIIMPSNAPQVKINAVKSYGGIITFCEPTLEARESTLKEIQEKTGATEVHPYNNEKVITGQATAAFEMITEHNDFDIIMTPVGGGGLLSGTALSCNLFSEKTKVIAAEPFGADDAYKSFYSKTFTPSVTPNTIADGLLTSLGSITFPIILQHVDKIIRVKEDTIIKAMHLIWERMKIIVEPSSAVALAAIMEEPETFENKKTGIIISGGNVDLNKLPW